MGEFKPRKSIEEINKRLKENNTTLQVIDTTNNPKKLLCHCSKCNQTFERDRKLLLYAIGCPVCDNRLVIKGYNDFIHSVYGKNLEKIKRNVKTRKK